MSTSTSTLCTSNPRFASQIVTEADLAALPAPVSLGRWHAPVPHIEVVHQVVYEAERRGLEVIKSRFALGAKGHALFGVLDFRGAASDRAVSLGFRTSTDQSVAMQAVAGARVFVCDNLALSGEFKAWSRKSTTHMDLCQLVRDGFALFAAQSDGFERSVRRLQGMTLEDYTAKSLLWDLFTDGVMPIKCMAEAHTNYFAPKPDWTDCEPRTMWSLHNALTRTVRQLAPARQLEVSADLGARFRLGVES